MALITFREIVDLIIMTAALGYIFMSYIRRPVPYRLKSGFNWDDFWFAIIITAPAIVLHELAHKFVALLFGLTAVFKAFFFGLLIGIGLKLIHSPFILVAPGYVQISGGSDLVTAITAFAGPFVNLVLFLGASYLLKNKKRLTQRQAMMYYLTKQVNLFLFIFNMLPIGPLDGAKVFGGLFRAIF